MHTLIDNTLPVFLSGLSKFLELLGLKNESLAQLNEASTTVSNTTMPPQRNSYHCAQSSKHMIFIVIVFVTATQKNNEFAVQASFYEGRRIRY